jgi:hypothetical protein
VEELIWGEGKMKTKICFGIMWLGAIGAVVEGFTLRGNAYSEWILILTGLIVAFAMFILAFSWKNDMS